MKINNNYFFVQSLQASLSFLQNSGALTAIDSIAYAILLVTLLVGVYEAFGAGANVGKLAGSVMKYVAAAGLIANWYTFFTALYNSTTSLASEIARQDFVSQLKQVISTAHAAYSAPSIFSFEGFSFSALVQAVLLILVPIIFWVVMILFELLFTIWGCILFCMGPLLLAVLPSMSLNTLSKNYLKSLVEWSLWPILYAIMGALALTASTGAFAVFYNSKSFADVLPNATTLIMMMIEAVAYVLFMVAIPFLAHYIMQGSFAGAMATAIGTAVGIKDGIQAVSKPPKQASGDGGSGGNSATALPAGSYDNRAPRATA